MSNGKVLGIMRAIRVDNLVEIAYLPCENNKNYFNSEARGLNLTLTNVR